MPIAIAAPTHEWVRFCDACGAPAMRDDIIDHAILAGSGDRPTHSWPCGHAGPAIAGADVRVPIPAPGSVSIIAGDARDDWAFEAGVQIDGWGWEIARAGSRAGAYAKLVVHLHAQAQAS